LVLGVIGPLLILLWKGRDDAYVRDHAIEALNFQLSALVGFVVAVVLAMAIGHLLVGALYLVGAALSLLASRAAHRGEPYRYPLCLRIIT
jgi:uncharacterized Tic20 family protein